MTQQHEYPAVRKLGGIEARMAAFHNYLQGSTQGTQVIGLTCVLPEATLMMALRHLFEKYEPLQCTIGMHEGQFHFYRNAQFSDIALTFLAVDANTDIDALVQAEVDTPLQADAALWKLTALLDASTHQHKLVMTAHHAIIDATGMNALATSLLGMISALLSGSPVPREVCGFPDPVDDLLKVQPVRAEVAPAVTTTRYAQTCPLTQRSTGWKAVVLKQNVLKRLQAAAARDRIKLHSLMSAAMCLAAADTALAVPPFAFHTAVSLRFLQRPAAAAANPLGCYMSIARSVIQSQDRDLAVLARNYERELLQRIITTCLQRPEVDHMSLEADVGKLGQLDHFVQGLGITNLGNIDIPTSLPGITVTDYMMLANRVSGNFSVVAQCYEFQGEQIVNFVYPKPLMSDEAVTRLCAAFSARLSAYGASELAAA